MRIKNYHVLGLLAVLALGLAACGAAPSQAFPGLVVDGELAFLAAGQHVRAVTVANGQQTWMFPNPANNDYGVFVAAPAVEDDLIVVGSEGPAGSYSGAVFGLDRATGQQRWCLVFDQKALNRLDGVNCTLAKGGVPPGLFGIGGAVDNRVIGGLTLFDGHVYFGLGNGTIFSVDAATGQDIWHYKAERDIWSAPVATEDRLYVGSLDHFIYALDRASGAEVWKQDLGAALAGTPTLDDGRLYIGTFANAMHALDAETGAEVWTPFRTATWVWDGPSVLDGTLYFADVGGTMYALNAENGQQVWAQKPGGAMRARPAATPESLFAGDRTGNIFALNPNDNGSTQWTKKLDGQILTTPAVAGDLIVVAPFGGNNLLEAYRANGDFSWAFAPGN